MDLTGYVMGLESLINRYLILIIIKSVPIMFLLLLTWGLPYLDKKSKSKHKKRKTKRKIESEKKSKIKNIIGQIIVSVLFVAVGVAFVLEDVDTRNNLKKDLARNSFEIYEGEAYLTESTPYLHGGAVFDLIIDERFVELENSDELYRIDMSQTWEGITDESDEFNGKIIYGKNSKYILKIE